MITYFLLAFALTNLIEFVPFNFFVSGKAKNNLLFILVINSITLPLIWVFLPFFFENYLFFFVLFEIMIFLIETILIKIITTKELLFSAKTALVMNLLSAFIGYFLF
ncbi:MAG: hypothetical protein HOE11_01855 [Candidatus Diapherotrites archaeon]|jgi:hypothetical protein|nr:hypothetical protein [Candidatus Diapherotrites archaeon]MBT4596601.1 hypothetical protein [Candidatus Diapherotrites archaeon]